MYSFFKSGDYFKEIVGQIEEKITYRFQEIDRIVEYNQGKVLKAFQSNKVADYHLKGSTGYGYDDIGREILDKLYAQIFDGEAAIVRPHIVSGTHALAIGLFGLLRPHDELLYITGKPYDTMEKVIGINGHGMGSLKDWGVSYNHVPLLDDGEIDYDEISKSITNHTKVIAIQRSRGYDWRPSFSVKQIKNMVDFVKEIKSDVITFVDNCYGEFTDTVEPTTYGADVIVGSLIKNPGGGIAKTGGYLVGKEDYIRRISHRLTAPGIGADVGSMYAYTSDFFQGIFLAPHFVGEALKGGVFSSAILEELGFETNPHWNESRNDIIQAIRFNESNLLLTFLQGIQKGSPIDSHVTPMPAELPGYQHPVIMAAGTFVQGASLELSGDAPYKEPYIGYMQGGLTYPHVKWGILTALDQMIDKGYLHIL